MKKIFTIVLIIILLAAGYFLITNKSKTPEQIPVQPTNDMKESDVVSNPEPETEIGASDETVIVENGNSVSLMINGSIVDTLTVSSEIATAYESVPKGFSMINSKNDINFDGINDVAILVRIDMGGVNMVYDYYVANTSTQNFVKFDSLSNISNFNFNPVKKTITTWSRTQEEFSNGLPINYIEHVFDGTQYVTVTDDTEHLTAFDESPKSISDKLKQLIPDDTIGNIIHNGDYNESTSEAELADLGLPGLLAAIHKEYRIEGDSIDINVSMAEFTNASEANNESVLNLLVPKSDQTTSSVVTIDSEEVNVHVTEKHFYNTTYVWTYENILIVVNNHNVSSPPSNEKLLQVVQNIISKY